MLLVLKGLLLLSVLKITPPSLQRSSTCCENVGTSSLCQSCAAVIEMGKWVMLCLTVPTMFPRKPAATVHAMISNKLTKPSFISLTCPGHISVSVVIQRRGPPLAASCFLLLGSTWSLWFSTHSMCWFHLQCCLVSRVVFPVGTPWWLSAWAWASLPSSRSVSIIRWGDACGLLGSQAWPGGITSSWESSLVK